MKMFYSELSTASLCRSSSQQTIFLVLMEALDNFSGFDANVEEKVLE